MSVIFQEHALKTNPFLKYNLRLEEWHSEASEINTFCTTAFGKLRKRLSRLPSFNEMPNFILLPADFNANIVNIFTTNLYTVIYSKSK